MTSKCTVLVTGGAGYIGSHAVLALTDAGWPVAVIDNLSTGFRFAVPEGVPFYHGDIADTDLLARIFAEQGMGSGSGAIMHFAGSVVVPESVEKPLDYYHNNTANSRTLIAAAVDAGVPHLLFSSTAATYGVPDFSPIGEDAPKRPINPYGWSKLMTERMLADTAKAAPLNYGALRYFNVAGADPQRRSGQSTPLATHLIKVTAQAALGQRSHVEIFGTDFPTPDGTGVRDYIHVTDLVEAHALLLDHLRGGGASVTLNCGYGRGYSVREVIDTVRRVSGREFEVREAPRRAGDPAAIVARADKVRTVLGWEPAHADLEEIVAAAYEWERHLATRNR